MKSDTLENKLREAHWLFDNHFFHAALTAYEYLAQKQPRNHEVLLHYGRALLIFGDVNTAERVWQVLIRGQRSNPEIWLQLGYICEDLRFPKLAQKYFEAAVAADRKAINPRISLASLYEKAHRNEAAREAIQACLRINPKDDQALYFSAFLNFREGKLESAEAQLRDLIASKPRHEFVCYSSRYVLADILDKTERYDEAMRYLAEAKEFVGNLPYSVAFRNQCPPHDWRGAIKALKAYPKDLIANAAKRLPAKVRGNGCRFAFLGGHPRSGTTLIEQILGAHPEIVAVDEPITSMISAEAIDPGASVSQITVARRRYIQTMEHTVGAPTAGKLLLEKNPGSTWILPNMLRLFPDMRLLIALRDPRDVILSIYFQNIPLNHVKYYTLEDFAKAYGFVMDIWLTVKEWKGFSWMETKYEDIVSDMKKEGRRVTKFLGLTWHQNQVSYFDAARKLRLYAPTYHDVTKPVYSRSVGRWRNYERYFESSLPILEPYCRAFGYV